MTHLRLVLLSVTSFLAATTIVAGYLAVPDVMRIVLGLVLVLILPGFMLLWAILPEGRLSYDERLLASVGGSMAITICVAVSLAATPIGLSRTSLSVALGALTLALSVYNGFRTRVPHDT